MRVKPALLLILAGCASAVRPPQGATVAPAVRVAWSADGAVVAGLGADGAVHAYDGQSGEPLWSFSTGRSVLPGLPRGAALEGLQLLPEKHGALVTAGGDLYLWRPGAPRAQRLTSTPAPELAAALSPNGELVAFVRDGDLWTLALASDSETRLTSHRELASPTAPRFRGARFAWAGESRTLALTSGEEGGVYVVDVATQTLRRLESGVAGSLISLAWRPDALGVALERISADGARLDLTLCHPEKLYCRVLASRAVGGGEASRRSFTFLVDGFLWGSARTTGEGLGRFDIVGRETGALFTSDWNLRELLMVDEDEAWAIATVSSSADPNRVATLATKFAGHHEIRLIAPDRALAAALFSPADASWVSFDGAGASLIALERGRVAALPALVAPTSD